MRSITQLSALLLLGISVCAGCRENLPPPNRATEMHEGVYETGEWNKPMPPQNADDSIPPPPYTDAPLVSQRVPEQREFVAAYNSVGRPHIVVFVNRASDSQSYPSYSRDEAGNRPIDYEALENVLTDWLSCDGQVALISPTIGHQALSPQQAQTLRNGQAGAGQDVAKQLDADILIQVQAQPTYASDRGTEILLVCEAIDLKHDGASLARATVGVPPPMNKPRINYYTRFVARKLMDGMEKSWSAIGSQPPRAENAPPPNDRAIQQPPQNDNGQKSTVPGNVQVLPGTFDGGLNGGTQSPAPTTQPIYPATGPGEQH